MSTATTIIPRDIGPPRTSAWVIAAAVALNLLALAMPLVMLQIFERVIPNEAQATLTLMFLALCVVAVLECLLRTAQGVLAAHDGAGYEVHVSTVVARRMLGAVSRDFERETVGAHLERFGAIAQVRDAVSGPARLVAIDVPFALVFMGLIAVIGGWLVLVPVTMVALLAAAGLAGRHWQARLIDWRKTVDGRRYAFLIEFLSDIATIKANCMEAQMTRRYEVLARQSVTASRELIHAAGVMQGFGAVIGQVGVAAMGLAGAGLVIGNAIGLGELAACMLLNGRTIQPLLKLMGLMGQESALGAARRRIADLAALPQRTDQTGGVGQIPAIRGRVEFDRLTLHDPGGDRPLLSDFSARLRPGERVRLVGGSPQATQALVECLLGDRAPSAGRVRIDGAPVSHAARHRGPGGIVSVASAPVIFHGSVMENLTLFGLLPRDLCLEVARDTGLAAALRRLPEGFETRLGHGASLQSAGFLQLVSLTRALCLSPRILVLENATASIDPAILATCADGFDRRIKGVTVVMVSGDPEIASIADREISLVPQSTLRSRAAWEADLAAERDGLPERRSA